MRLNAELEELRAASNVCVCQSLRKASRATTQLYDRHLGPSGLTTVQFSVLLKLRENHPMTMSELAKRLVMDRTTLTRNLELLVDMGLVEPRRGKDRRTRYVSLTPKGDAAVGTALPLWAEAQSHMAAGLGSDEWRELGQALRKAIAAVS